MEISRDTSDTSKVEGGEEVEKTHQTSAAKNVSLFFGMRNFGILLTAYFSGFLLDYITKQDGS